MPEIDLLQRHEYNQGNPKWFKPLKDLNALQRIPTSVQKPFVFGEFGFSPNGEADTPAGRESLHLHHGLWASVFNGYASTALYWWWDALVDPANLWLHYKGLAQFIRGEDVARMAPLPAQSSALFAAALALKKQDGALVWLRNTGYDQPSAQAKFLISQSTGERYTFAPKPVLDVAVTLDGLANGIYRVRWYDTLSGDMVSEEKVKTTQKRLVVKVAALPRDLAAKITRLNSLSD